MKKKDLVIPESTVDAEEPKTEVVESAKDYTEIGEKFVEGFEDGMKDVEIMPPEQSMAEMMRIMGAQTQPDMVNHPPHYNVGGFEVIDIIQAFTEGLNGAAAYATGNIIKYVLRWHRKNGLEDLKKAKWYIDYILDKYSDVQEGDYNNHERQQ